MFLLTKILPKNSSKNIPPKKFAKKFQESSKTIPQKSVKFPINFSKNS